MRSFIKLNMKRSTFIIALLITTFFASYSFFLFVEMQKNQVSIRQFSPYLFNTITESNMGWYFFLLFPVLVGLPSSMELYRDQVSGVDQILVAKLGRKKYYVKRLLSVFITTFIVFTLPFLIELILGHLIFKPQYFNMSDSWQGFYWTSTYYNYKSMFLSGLFFRNQFLYSVLSIVNTGIVAGLIATFTSSFIYLNFKLAVFNLLPAFLFCSLIQIIFSYNDLTNFLVLLQEAMERNLSLNLFLYVFLLVVIVFNTMILCKNNRVLLYGT